MIRLPFFVLGFIVEIWALFHAAWSSSFAEGAFWFSMATYAAVAAISCRQIANGHSYFSRNDKP